MNLLQIRTKAVEMSGRYDLVVDTTSYVDNGMNFFIEAGLKFLDQRQPHPDSQKWYKKDIVAGDYKLNFPYCNAIKEVWMANSDGKFQLERKPLAWLREAYALEPADETQGTPLYFCPIVIGLAPTQKRLTAVGGSKPYTAEFTYDYEELLFGSEPGYRGVMWMPPVDEAHTVSILGDFLSTFYAWVPVELVDTWMLSDTASNYWSVEHPILLVQATLFAIETFYRNTEGMKDMLNAIDVLTSGIDNSMAEEESYDASEMEG